MIEDDDAGIGEDGGAAAAEDAEREREQRERLAKGWHPKPFGDRESRAVREGDGIRRGPLGHDLDHRREKLKRRRELGLSTPRNTPLGKDRNPGGARWCEEHQALECTGSRRAGRGPCHSPAIRGMAGCARHVGMKVSEAVLAGEAKITAWTAIGAPASGGTGIDAASAVMGMLNMSWLRVALYSGLLKRQFESGGAGGAGGVGSGDAGGVGGLIGHKFAAVPGTGEIYATSEEVRALAALESAERDRVVRYAKVAHDMGIAQQMADLAEKWSDVVAGAVTAMLADLMLTPEQQELVPVVVVRHLQNIDMSAIEG